MSAHATAGGSPVTNPQRYHTLPITVITQAEQQDRCLKQSELNELNEFFKSGAKRLEIVVALSNHANEIVAAAADRIFAGFFSGGSPMDYLAPPPNRDNLPGFNVPFRQFAAPVKEKLAMQATGFGNPFRFLKEFLQTRLNDDRDPLPGGFSPINIRRYGPRRMRNSMRDLAWFLRYATYAIAAGDSSILSVNVRGLRGVIPEDVTEATVIAMREMRWRSLRLFKGDPEAQAMIREPFDVMIAEYLVEKPSSHIRQGISNDQQGLELPDNYVLSAIPQTKFVINSRLSDTDQQAGIRAAYHQIFERDIRREYGDGTSLTELESKVKGGEISTREFIRRLGKSKLYRREFYEPFVISRVIELATRHFLGRGLSSIEEFQDYFEVISQGGLPALIDHLVDSKEYGDYFGEETVPYLRTLGQEAQFCCNWMPQIQLFKYSAIANKVPQFITLFGEYRQPLPNQHSYGVGNDPLEIQFGAIFPHTSASPDHPALFNSDHRRILISCGLNGNGSNNDDLGYVPGALNHRVLKLEQTNPLAGFRGNGNSQGVNVNLVKNSALAVIEGAYRQLFGRQPYPDQRPTAAELKLKSGEITVREFVRQAAKSRLFRQLYWDSLYVTKAIEYIHRRLLGRPTVGRQEMGNYYDICARKGFFALIDALVDSPEYSETFGEDTVPYERFVTPRGYAMRSRSSAGVWHGYHDRLGSTMNGPRVAEDYSGWLKAAAMRSSIHNGAIHRTSLEDSLATLKPVGVEVLEEVQKLNLEPAAELPEQPSSTSGLPRETTSSAANVLQSAPTPSAQPYST